MWSAAARVAALAAIRSRSWKRHAKVLISKGVPARDAVSSARITGIYRARKIQNYAASRSTRHLYPVAYPSAYRSALRRGTLT